MLPRWQHVPHFCRMICVTCRRKDLPSIIRRRGSLDLPASWLLSLAFVPANRSLTETFTQGPWRKKSFHRSTGKTKTRKNRILATVVHRSIPLEGWKSTSVKRNESAIRFVRKWTCSQMENTLVHALVKSWKSVLKKVDSYLRVPRVCTFFYCIVFGTLTR